MLFLPIIVSLFGLVFAYFLIREVKGAPSGEGKQIEIQKAIREEMTVFLKRQCKTVGLFAFFLFLILSIFLGFKVGFGFLAGAVFSALACLAGMTFSIQTNLKVIQSAQKELKSAFNLSFRGGSVSGFLVTGLGLLSVSIFYFLTHDFQVLTALCFGSGLIAIFARFGDSLSDCSGTAGDIFQTYVVTLVAAMFLGSLIFPDLTEAIFLPLILVALAVLASIISVFFVKLRKNQSPEREQDSYGAGIVSAFYKGLIGAGALSVFGFLPIIFQAAPILKLPSFSLYLPVIVGLLIAGLVIRIKTTFLSIILVSTGILISFAFGGMYGLALTAVSMVSLAGLIVALDYYGLIANNVSEISGMAGLPEENRKITDILGAVNNTTKAMVKGYAITSAGLVALVLFLVYTQKLMNLGGKVRFFLEDPKVLIGLFIGGAVSYYFAVLATTAAEKATFKKIFSPALLPVIFPILVGFILGPEALGGLLIGSIVVGIFLAISMAANPAISPMIKTLNIAALLIVGFLV